MRARLRLGWLGGDAAGLLQGSILLTLFVGVRHGDRGDQSFGDFGE